MNSIVKIIILLLSFKAIALDISCLINKIRFNKKLVKKASAITLKEGTKLFFYAPYRATMFYPEILSPILKQHGVKGIWRVPVKIITKDGVTLSIIALLAATSNRLYYSGLEYLDDTEDLLPKDRNSNVVIIDGFADWEIQRLGVLYMRLATYRKYKNVFVVRGTWDEVTNQLQEITNTHGKISIIDYMAHGTEGLVNDKENDPDMKAISPQPYLQNKETKNLIPKFKNLIEDQGTFRNFGCESGHNEYTAKYSALNFMCNEGNITASKEITAVFPNEVSLGLVESIIGNLPPRVTSIIGALDRPAELLIGMAQLNTSARPKPLFKTQFKAEDDILQCYCTCRAPYIPEKYRFQNIFHQLPDKKNISYPIAPEFPRSHYLNSIDWKLLQNYYNNSHEHFCNIKFQDSPCEGFNIDGDFIQGYINKCISNKK